MKNFLTIKSKHKGFTLIELLVVIAIISLLSSVVLAALRDTRDKAKDKAIISQMANMRLSAEQAYSDGSYGIAGDANDCDGLLNSSYLVNFNSASKWPAVTGEAASIPICFSNASNGGELITAYSLWHKTNEGGWCFDSTGSSLSMSTAPGSEICSEVGGVSEGTLVLGEACVLDNECEFGLACGSGVCGGNLASCTQGGVNPTQCVGTYCDGSVCSSVIPNLGDVCPVGVCQTGTCLYDSGYGQDICQ